MTIARLLISASIAAFTIGGAQPALADGTAEVVEDASDQSGLQEIVVTAQKREENLQDTPIAISVLSDQALEDRSVVSILDLGDGAIPSLKIAPFFSRPGALIVNIRGIGVLSDSNQPGRDQGVGVYVDGVYLGRAQGLATALFDVQNIEVLKGPQGTLFGRNTMGGAVSIVTKKPSGEFGLNATASIGNYGSHKGEVHLDLPAVGNISTKVDAVIARRGAFVDNPLDGAEDFGSYDKRGFHLGLLWEPSDNFSAQYDFDISRDETSTNYFQQISPGLGLPTQATCLPGVTTCPVPPNTRAAIFQSQPNRATRATFGVPQQPSIGRTKGIRLGLEYEASDSLRFRSISSFRRLFQSQFDNANAAPSVQQATPISATGVITTPSFLNFQFARYSWANFTQKQLSQEFQIIGELPRLNFQAGALYYRENVQDDARAFNTLQFTDALGSTFIQRAINFNAQVIQRASKVETTSIGAYGQFTYTPPIGNDIIHLTGGLRWTRDKKDGQLFTVNGAFPIIPINGINVQAPINRNERWSRVDPLVNLSVDLSDDVHVYGKWSTGYRSGGANSRSLSFGTFNPESVSMFEAGLKSEFFDRRVRLNIAGYYGDYKGIQLDFSGLYEDIINGVRVATTRTTTDTVNAPGKGKLKGLEAELTIAPVDGLTLSASYAYNSVKIPDTRNPFPQPGGVFITVPLPIYQVYTPQNTASGAIDFETPVGNATLRAHIDANYSDGYYINYTDPDFDTVTRAVRLKQPKGDNSFLVNARLGVADISMPGSDGKLGISVWARNLLNEQHVFYKSGSARAGISGFFNEQRTFGAELKIEF
jgi:iron complex outermembrane recepter protein